MLRRVLLGASRSRGVQRAVSGAPVTRGVVRRFVAGETPDDAVRVVRQLRALGLATTLDRLGEDVTEVGHADATTKAYVAILGRLADEDLADVCEVSLKLSAVGQALDPAMALDNARAVCEAAATAGTTVTIDMEDHRTTDATLSALAEMRLDFPWVGAVIQAYLRRSESDCRDLAAAGSRVRLCKGAYNEPESVAFQRKHEVDRSYVRCLRTLMEGRAARPMVATHDPRLIAIAADLARRTGRARDSYEYQMLYGVRPEEQRRLARSGDVVRIYVPYGDEWYAYLMRRLAERPANVAFFVRSVVTTT